MRPLRRRRRSMLVLVRVYAFTLIVLAAILGGAGYGLAVAPQLKARDVVVKSSPHVSTNEIRAAAMIDPESNAWLLDTHAIASRIEAIPWVDRAVISRTLPATVTLAVTERRAWACVAAHGDLREIDESGRVLSTGCSPSLPLLEASAAPPRPGSTLDDARTRELMRDLEQLEPMLALRLLAFDRFGQLEAATRERILIRFGSDDDLSQKLHLISPILAATESRARHVRTIDVRAPLTPVVTY